MVSTLAGALLAHSLSLRFATGVEAVYLTRDQREKVWDRWGRVLNFACYRTRQSKYRAELSHTPIPPVVPSVGEELGSAFSFSKNPVFAQNNQTVNFPIQRPQPALPVTLLTYYYGILEYHLFIPIFTVLRPAFDQ